MAVAVAVAGSASARVTAAEDSSEPAEPELCSNFCTARCHFIDRGMVLKGIQAVG